jgi:cation:H+ antiporter
VIFLISGALVVLAGARLSRDGEAIAQRTGLGGLWVGAILVAGATSLPEILTDLYAVRQGTPSLAFGYGVGMRVLHANRPEPPFTTPDQAAEAARGAPSLRQAVVGFALAALLILGAARFLASSAADLAAQLGISTGFAGLVLLAVTTSLPELVVSLASVRAGAYDLAVGNLLGSNCFNMVILVALDIADGPGSLLAQVEPGVVVGGLFAVLLMGQVLMEVLNRAERRLWYLEPNAVLLVATYALGLWLAAQAGREGR